MWLGTLLGALTNWLAPLMILLVLLTILSRGGGEGGSAGAGTGALSDPLSKSYQTMSIIFTSAPGPGHPIPDNLPAQGWSAQEGLPIIRSRGAGVESMYVWKSVDILPPL